MLPANLSPPRPRMGGGVAHSRTHEELVRNGRVWSHVAVTDGREGDDGLPDPVPKVVKERKDASTGDRPPYAIPPVRTLDPEPALKPEWTGSHRETSVATKLASEAAPMSEMGHTVRPWALPGTTEV